jgi:hypothetical protein
MRQNAKNFRHWVSRVAGNSGMRHASKTCYQESTVLGKLDVEAWCLKNMFFREALCLQSMFSGKQSVLKSILSRKHFALKTCYQGSAVHGNVFLADWRPLKICSSGRVLPAPHAFLGTVPREGGG